MKSITSRGISGGFQPASIRRGLISIALAGVSAGLALPSCVAAPAPTAAHPPVRTAEVVIRADPGRARPPFEFEGDDAALLDEVQRGALAYFLHEVDPGTGLVRDRSGADTISVAGVGYQLAAHAIGVERGWLDEAEARARTEKALRSLLGQPANRKAGLFYHFLNPGDASPRRLGTELVVSTIDSAILFAGAMVAGEYFGGEVAVLADRMVGDADWAFFLNGAVDFERGDAPSPDRGFLSLGWRPDSDADPTGEGSLIPYSWVDCGDEHRLTTLIAVCASDADRRVTPETYYQLRRQVGVNPDAPDEDALVVWFPYSGALFTAFFAHCWVDYASLGADSPAAFGVDHRARVDWWENSRRLVRLHRDKAIANPESLPTLGPDAWGLSACDGPEGYLVPGVYPERVEMIGAAAGRDFPQHDPSDQWGGGVVAPYAAASSVVFEPDLALRAMRRYRSVEDPRGEPLAWLGSPEAPAAGGARGLYGFADSFRDGPEPWRARDTVAIDHGPMLILIENARTGLVWELFHRHARVQDGLERLGLVRGAGGAAD
jgi:hypothetical protein